MKKAFFVMAFCFFSGFLLKTLFFNSSAKKFGKAEETEDEMDRHPSEAVDIGYAESAPVEAYDGPGADEWVDLQEEPRPINMDQFKQAVGYPPMAREAEIEGKVFVRVNVDSYGRYLRHIVLRSPHPILTNAVESKLSMLQFTPGVQHGRPVSCWITIPVDFQLSR